MRMLILLCIAALALACSRGVRKDAGPPLAADVPQTLARARGLSQAETVEHLLSRATFGPRPQDCARVQRIGAAALLEEQLHPQSIADSALERRLGQLGVPSPGGGEPVRNQVPPRKVRQD